MGPGGPQARPAQRRPLPQAAAAAPLVLCKKLFFNFAMMRTLPFLFVACFVNVGWAQQSAVPPAEKLAHYEVVAICQDCKPGAPVEPYFAQVRQRMLQKVGIYAVQLVRAEGDQLTFRISVAPDFPQADLYEVCRWTGLAVRSLLPAPPEKPTKTE